jgi:hypothetical protein
MSGDLPIELARIAYEAYSRALFDGDPLPLWEALPDDMKAAWVAAADAIKAEVLRPRPAIFEPDPYEPL